MPAITGSCATHFRNKKHNDSEPFLTKGLVFVSRYLFLEYPNQVKIPPPIMAKAIIPIMAFLSPVRFVAGKLLTVSGVDVIEAPSWEGVRMGRRVWVAICVRTRVGEPVGTIRPCLINKLLPG